MNQPAIQSEARQTNRMTAVVHRLQRPYREGEALRKGEFVADITPGVPGVYRAIPLGTVVGGSVFERLMSSLRIRLANFRVKVARIRQGK